MVTSLKLTTGLIYNSHQAYISYQEGNKLFFTGFLAMAILSLVFVAPEQVVSIEDDGEDYQPSGYAVLFHPDLLSGTSLGNSMKEYNFFSYDVFEALHLSEKEKEIVMKCLRKIEYEVEHAIDRHSRKLIISNIELLLNYCVRFYNRQFITRDHVNSGVLETFENLLTDYFQSDKPLQLK